MTAGPNPAEPVRPWAAPEDPQRPTGPDSAAPRPGPQPPEFRPNPSRPASLSDYEAVTAPIRPAPPGGSPPPAAGRPMSPPASGRPMSPPAAPSPPVTQPYPGPPSGPGYPPPSYQTPGYQAPGYQAPGPVPGTALPPTSALPASGVPGQPPPGSSPAVWAPTSAGPGLTRPAPLVPAKPRRGGRLGVVAFVLVLLLLGVAGVQAYLLVNLDRRVDRSDRAASTARADANRRLRELDARAAELEKRTLDSSAVAKDVLPSVFRVTAGNFSGTAFAIGRPPSDGGTDLVTNYHVIEALYTRGGRDVALEHQDQRFSAKISKVDASGDLALLHTTEKFTPLVAASSPALPGQPVVVVGAPLGLSGTVTTGVVSAVRDTPDGKRLQFDAPINPGNSGGPVINAQRQVVGVATAKARNAEGIGLAIPITVVCESLGIC